MTKAEMLNIVYKYLADNMNCNFEDLKKNGVTFTVSSKVDPYLRIAICGNSVIVSASAGLSSKISTFLQGKSIDELFECPLVYGQTLHYIPDMKRVVEAELPEKYTYALFENEQVRKLVHLRKFENALDFDDDGELSSVVALVAYDNGVVIAVAGASAASDQMWEIGVDVDACYRCSGLATALTVKLTHEVLRRNIIPFYSASITNLGSQMVAARAGYIPCWVDSWGNIFDDFYPYKKEISIGKSITLT